jgi:hypothetical protein
MGDLSIRWGRKRPGQRPRLIVWMSLQLAIPWQVALLQSLPPLHQPGPVSCNTVFTDERFILRSTSDFGKKQEKFFGNISC